MSYELPKNYKIGDPESAARVMAERAERLQWILAHPETIPDLKAFYAKKPIQFIIDWGVTRDARNALKEGAITVMPLIPFPRQIDMLEFYWEHMIEGRSGIIKKSRDTGASMGFITLSDTACLFNHNLKIGFGSNLERNVDTRGNDKSLFERARLFLEDLPAIFTQGYNRNNPKYGHTSLIIFPETNSTIAGDYGKNIGRGDRVAAYFVDEFAELEAPMEARAALSRTSDVRFFVSSVKGYDNNFTTLCLSGDIDVFEFHYRDDPRMTPERLEEIRKELASEVIWAQQMEMDFGAASEGLVIPGDWVRAAINLAEDLGLDKDGVRLISYDAADLGNDLNAVCFRQGISVEKVLDWSGKRSNLFKSAEKAFGLADDWNTEILIYDAVGVGAGFPGHAMVLNNQRQENNQDPIRGVPFNGGSKANHPNRKVPGTKKKNVDHFANLKAQAYGYLAYRFEQAYKARMGVEYDQTMVISLSEKGIGPQYLSKLIAELSQPTQSPDGKGRLVINKTPKGTKSPNLADAVAMAFAPVHMPLIIPQEYL